MLSRSAGAGTLGKPRHPDTDGENHCVCIKEPKSLSEYCLSPFIITCLVNATLLFFPFFFIKFSGKEVHFYSLIIK